MCAEGQMKRGRRTNRSLQIASSDTQKSPRVSLTDRLLAEAEVQAGALCDRGGGAGTGYSTGGDTAIFLKTNKNKTEKLTIT